MTALPLLESISLFHEIAEEAGIDYAIVGAIALGAWGLSRATEDVDVLAVLDEENLTGLLEAARRRGFGIDEEEIELFEPGGFFRLDAPSGGHTYVDVLVADPEFGANVVARRRFIERDGAAVPVASLDDLVLMKLVAFRPEDTVDVEKLIDLRRDRLDLDHLRRWADRLHIRGRLEAFLEPVDED